MNRWLFLASLLLWLGGCTSLPSAPPSPATAPVPTSSTPAPSETPNPEPAAAPPGLRPLASNQPHQDPIAHLSLPHDLWERVRRGFAMPDLETDLVEERVQWYASRPDYLLRMTERSRKYIYHIVEELERREMPTELALLPFIESAFNPHAVSSAKAMGMWQFMPGTGKDFDLKQNVFRDDRRDVLASTRAALDYLQRLYGMFGDWHLALAAYNWGEGNVGKAIARNQRSGLGTAYTDLTMPMETRFYVPKLQAIKNLVARPAQYNVQLPEIHNHPYFQSVPLPRDMDVTVAAKLAGISVDDFKSLNPSASRPVLLAAGTPQILLPWDNAETFQQNYETFAGGQLASWTAWVAPTTLKVSEAARRAGLSEDEFRRINNIPPRMLIKAGSALLVPRSARMDEDVKSEVADNGRLELSPEIEPRRVVVKLGKKDTLATLAQQYKVTEAQIAEWNDWRPGTRLQAGQSVVLMLSTPVRVVAKQGGKGSKVQTARASTRSKAKSPVPVAASTTKLAKR